MATTVSPLGNYHLEYANAAGGGFNGTTFLSINASSLANAQTVGQSLSTLIQANVKLTSIGVLAGGENVYTPAAQGGTVSAPATVLWSPQ